MSNKKRDELACTFSIKHIKDIDGNGVINETTVEAFKAGYDARDAEVKKLVEALELVIHRENLSFRGCEVTKKIWIKCNQVLEECRVDHDL